MYVGTMALVALESGRNVISIVENEEDRLVILHNLQAKYFT